MSWMINQKISERFLSNIWLFENMLWKYAHLVAIDQDKERIKRILSDVYGFKDINELFPQELDKNAMDRLLKTVFTYHDEPHELEMKNKI